MSQTIIYVDTSTKRSGKLPQLETAMKQLAAFVEANEPQLISYGFFLDDSRTQMTVVAVHPDLPSLEFHMDVGREEFRKFSDLITRQHIDVYGRVTDSVLERLQQKASMLGSGSVTVHDLYAGFER